MTELRIAHLTAKPRLRDALERALGQLAADVDCDGCVEEFMDDMDVLHVDSARDVLDIARTDGAYAAIEELRALLSRA